MKLKFIIPISFLFANLNFVSAQKVSHVGLYRTFEQALVNTNTYANKFSDVQVNCTYIAPSGKATEFYGFFDGDGKGGGDFTTGNTWKIRFIPNEMGEWKYQWSWSDATAGGEGTFMCDSVDAGKGILRPYKENPRWFAYNGTDPVWIKSYYESGHGSLSQPLEWITKNIYQPIIDRGYNHLQVNWLLSLCCFEQFYHDGPAQTNNDLALYQSGKASSTMRLDVWKLMEQNVEWLNERNIGLNMFLGFDGSKNNGPEWDKLSPSEKDFYVRYVVARLAPYANIAGWGFVWEVPGDRQDYELGWAQLVQKYDVFDHLRTYEDEHPNENFYHRAEYNFAAIENHSMYSSNRDEDRKYWAEAWTHHKACLEGYSPGKPVLMIEGNALWRRFWSKRTGATQDDLRQAAWACVTGGASFLWCGHQGEESLVAFGEEGLPFFGEINPYSSSALELDILSDVMNKELNFETMTPADSLLSEHNNKSVWCLAEPGEQYLIFAANGSPFKIQLAEGQYHGNQWMNTKTGADIKVPEINAKDNQAILFDPPGVNTDWILLIRKEGK